MRGVVGELEKLTASLYARYERVRAVKKTLSENQHTDLHRRIYAEEAMLKQVLDWLSVNTEGSV